MMHIESFVLEYVDDFDGVGHSVDSDWKDDYQITEDWNEDEEKMKDSNGKELKEWWREDEVIEENNANWLIYILSRRISQVDIPSNWQSQQMKTNANTFLWDELEEPIESVMNLQFQRHEDWWTDW